jgi:hypothetical protein
MPFWKLIAIDDNSCFSTDGKDFMEKVQEQIDSFVLENVPKSDETVDETFHGGLPFETLLKLKFHLPDSDFYEDPLEEAAYLKKISHTLSTYRLVIMVFGVFQCFAILLYLDIDWPTFFVELFWFLPYVTVSFAFFHPECSAKLEFWKLWLIFLVIPLLVLIPLYFSYAV